MLMSKLHLLKIYRWDLKNVQMLKYDPESNCGSQIAKSQWFGSSVITVNTGFGKSLYGGNVGSKSGSVYLSLRISW